MSSKDPKEPDDAKPTDPVAQSRFGDVLPGLELVSEGDINLDNLPSQFDDMPAAAPPATPGRAPSPPTPAKSASGELVADSRVGETLPGLELVSEGDIDLGDLPSQFDDLPPASPPVNSSRPPRPPAPPTTSSGDPVAQSQFGDSLPGLELVSEGEINLANLPSQIGELPPVPPPSVPALKLVTPKTKPAKPASPEAQSRAGESLPGVELASEGDVNLGELPSHFDHVPLAKVPESPSGQSLTSWTEVIRRQRAAQGTAQTADAVKVDAASDKDLLTRLVEAEARGDTPSSIHRAKGSGDTDEYPEASLPVFTQPLSESEIDLGPFSPGAVGGESDIKFDIEYPPSDAGGAMPLPSGGLPPLSSVDFRKHMPPRSGSGLLEVESIPFAVAVATDPSESDLDLGAVLPAVPGEPGRSSILDVLLREPDAAAAAEQASDLLDYGALQPVRSSRPTMPTTGAGPARPIHVSTQPGIDLAGGDAPPESAIMNLAGPASGYSSDDAIDLYAEGGAIPSLSDSGTLEISDEVRAESQRRTEAQESSSIDLNSRPSMSGSEFDMNLANAPARGSESDIDLNLPAVVDTGSSSLVHPPGGLAANRDVIAAEFEARRRNDEPELSRRRKRSPVPLDGSGSRGGRGYLIHGGVIGLLLGAGGVLAAYFGGALPDRGAKPVVAAPDNSAEVAKLRDEATEARKQAEAAKVRADGAIAHKEANDTKITELTASATKAQNDLTAVRKLAEDAKTMEDTAKKKLVESEKAVAAAKTELTDATKTATAAKKELADATTALEAARKETTEVKKTAEDKLAVARAEAEIKEKDATLKLAVAAKKETDLAKLVDSAKKTAEDAAKARDASDATVKAISERLAKAKFVGDKADPAALVSGLDAAIKAATTDSTAGLREDLVKARDAEVKLKTDLVAAKEKEIESAKTAAILKIDAQKLQQELKLVETKAASDTAKLRGDVDKLSKDFTDANAKAVAAEKIAIQEKAQADRMGTELSKLKTDNDRLARDLEAVKELAAILKATSGAATGPLVRPEPSKLAERFFGKGLSEYIAGNYVEAESDFRKSLQFSADDARVHYLLGLALWMTKDAKGAETEFEKGRDLEMAGRPGSRAISAVLERIQGPARQAVNAYRP
jgi:hypothetical protein